LFKRLIILVLLISVTKTQDLKENIHKDPKKAFYFSLVPGMGQIYNGKTIKAAMVIGLEIVTYTSWKENRYKYNDYHQNNFPLKRHRYLEKRNKYAWWIAIIYAYSMIDAIVDAHLHSFDRLMDSPIKQENKKEENYAE